MSSTTVNTNIADGGSWSDSMPLLILAVCLTIGLIAFLYGLRRLLHRRRAHRNDHLVVDMAEPETLRDLPPDRQP
jgi:hypothetical protein